jgi:hypothetical protein
MTHHPFMGRTTLVWTLPTGHICTLVVSPTGVYAMKTFEQFQQTRQWSDDLAVSLPWAVFAEGEVAKGWIYLDQLFIENK